MQMAQEKPVAIVTGVGPGLGAALVRRFANDYAVAMIARNGDYLKSLAGEVGAQGGHAVAFPADVGDRGKLETAFKQIREQLGDAEVLLYNAGSGNFGNILEISPEQYETSWRVNSYGAFISAKEVASAMVARGKGVMLFTGATAGVKAGAKSVAFRAGQVRDARPRAVTLA